MESYIVSLGSPPISTQAAPGITASSPHSSTIPFRQRYPFPVVFLVLISKKNMARYTFSHSELYHNDVPFGYRFVRLGLEKNLPRWYEMGRYRG